MHPGIAACLRAPTRAEPCADVATWWERHRALAAGNDDTVALALAAGFAADRPGWAFASGYQAALRALLPGLPADTLAALCVTEAGGNRPRDIQTRVTAARAGGGLRLDGAKRWTTLGPESTLLLVVARDETGQPNGEAGGRPRLTLLRVPADAPGVVVRRMPEFAFIPEVPHGSVEFSGVELAPQARVPGDAYDAYVKPFRTVEDIHVMLALLACLMREARGRQWPPNFRERLTAALAVLAEAPADAPATHVALSGALRWAQTLLAEADGLWPADVAADPAAGRWRRDRPLFGIAAGAREARASRAWERLARPVC